MVKTVVVVDDDADTLDFLELLLSLEGFQVVACAHDAGVGDIIREVRPDLVLLDLQTPTDRRAGLVLLRQLRADAGTATTKVIVMSTDRYALADHAARLGELRATSLWKLDLEQLRALLEQTSLSSHEARAPAGMDTAQQADGSSVAPEVLRPSMDATEVDMTSPS